MWYNRGNKGGVCVWSDANVMAWRKKQPPKKTKQTQNAEELSCGDVTQDICGDFHVALAARVATLLGVPDAHVARILAHAQMVARVPSSEHPDVRVLRGVWELSAPYATQMDVSTDDASFFAIPDPVLRVMAALRIVDRVPYETLAAVWRGYTPQRIAQEIGAACHQLYRMSEPAEHIAQSDFVQVWRLADAQLSAAQMAHMREDISAHARAGWAFYDALRAAGLRIGAEHAVRFMCSVPRSAPLHDAAAVSAESALAHQLPAVAPSQPRNTPEKRSQEPTEARANTAIARRTHRWASSPFVRRVALFAAMILVTIILVGGALFVLAQFGAGAPAPSEADIRTQGLTAPKEAVATQRSVQEIVQSLQEHARLATEDVPEALLAEDALLTGFADDVQRAEKLLERM